MSRFNVNLCPQSKGLKFSSGTTLLFASPNWNPDWDGTWVGFNYYHQITDIPLSSLNYDYDFGTCLTEISKKKGKEKKQKYFFRVFSFIVAAAALLLLLRLLLLAIVSHVTQVNIKFSMQTRAEPLFLLSAAFGNVNWNDYYWPQYWFLKKKKKPSQIQRMFHFVPWKLHLYILYDVLHVSYGILWYRSPGQGV